MKRKELLKLTKIQCHLPWSLSGPPYSKWQRPFFQPLNSGFTAFKEPFQINTFLGQPFSYFLSPFSYLPQSVPIAASVTRKRIAHMARGSQKPLKEQQAEAECPVADHTSPPLALQPSSEQMPAWKAQSGTRDTLSKRWLSGYTGTCPVSSLLRGERWGSSTAELQ